MPVRSILGRDLGFDPNSMLFTSRGAPVLGVPRGRGKDFYVSSLVGAAGSDGKGPYSAVTTIKLALAKCTANNGDRIIVLPGHSEALANTTDLDLNKAGVEIIGLGTGEKQPKVTIGTANTATITVSADDVIFRNIRVVANFLSIAAAFTSAAAKHFRIRECRFTETSSTLNFLNIFKGTGGANTNDGLEMSDCEWDGLGTTSVNAAILSANTIDRLVVLRNKWKSLTTVDAAWIVFTAGIVTNADIGYNKGYRQNTAQANGTLVNVGGTTSTGWVYNNYIQSLSTASDKLFTTTVGLGAFENRVSGAVGATGFVIPAVDS